MPRLVYVRDSDLASSWSPRGHRDAKGSRGLVVIITRATTSATTNTQWMWIPRSSILTLDLSFVSLLRSPLSFSTVRFVVHPSSVPDPRHVFAAPVSFLPSRSQTMSPNNRVFVGVQSGSPLCAGSHRVQSAQPLIKDMGILNTCDSFRGQMAPRSVQPECTHQHSETMYTIARVVG